MKDLLRCNTQHSKMPLTHVLCCAHEHYELCISRPLTSVLTSVLIACMHGTSLNWVLQMPDMVAVQT